MNLLENYASQDLSSHTQFPKGSSSEKNPNVVFKIFK